MPGGVFHLAARTLGKERLFRARTRAASLEIIARVASGSEASLLAVAIMPTHLHLVVQQGRDPIKRLMQPLLRRLATLLQRDRQLEGPIFWRPYACEACMDPSHARNAIVYTHLNPVRAGLCTDPAAYPWTSHALYTGDNGPGRARSRGPSGPLAGVVEPERALPLFATGPGRTAEQLRDDYRRFVAWRLAVDRSRDGDELASPMDPRAEAPWDPAWAFLRWGAALSPLFHAPGSRVGRFPVHRPPRPTADMNDIARSVLASRPRRLELGAVKGRGGGAEHARTRHAMIRAMAAAGHRSVDIATFLRLSESAVSKVIRSRLAAPS